MWRQPKPIASQPSALPTNSVYVHPDTIDGIERHVDHQADTDQTDAGEPGHSEVGSHGPGGVQGMKTDAATVGIVGRGGQEMIQVDTHGEKHDEPGALPARRKRQPGNCAWYEHV